MGIRTALITAWVAAAALVYAEATGRAKEPANAAAEIKGNTALIDYVNKPDPAYTWKLVRKVESKPSTTFVVRLTSQTWRTAKEVDRPLWEHWLTIVKPNKPAFKKAFLLIGGGSNGGNPPDKADAVVRQIAENTQSVVAELKMIPNQPLVFHNDGVKRKEDDLIAYAWDQYLKTGDATWLPRFPMVKSASRAMDCIQELLAGEQGGGVAIEKFVVAGASKRGWTTWMTGVADPRVAAIVPIVIDVLNVDKSMRHHAAVYGFWARAIGNYVQHGITEQWTHPRMREIYSMIDPYYHRQRLQMPKFIVNASGDQFFCPDSSQFYFDKLSGEKLIRYVPNADHSLRNSDAIESIAAYYQLILAGKPRPRYAWQFAKDGSIRVTATDKPQRVRLWQATNPAARDFRVKTIGRAYTSIDLDDQGKGVYVGRVKQPAKGWTAFFVELSYPTDSPMTLKVSTGIRILPETLPHADIDVTKTPYEGR